MHRAFFVGLSAVLGGLLLATASQAATLTSATWFQVVQHGGFNNPGQGFPMTRTHSQLGASGNSTATSVALNLSYPSLSTNFFVPKTANGLLDLAIKITQGGPQSITATAAAGSGSPGIPGTVIVMTAMHVGVGPNVSMFVAGMNTLIAVPLSIGKARAFTATFTVLGNFQVMTVDFYAWTPGTLTFTSLTTRGKALPSVVAMGSFGLTAMGGGTVALVSPSKVSVDGIYAQRRTASFTKLALSFLPEPGTLLLLGGAALAVARVLRPQRD
jgi:hypothetical protein